MVVPRNSPDNKHSTEQVVVRPLAHRGVADSYLADHRDSVAYSFEL